MPIMEGLMEYMMPTRSIIQTIRKESAVIQKMQPKKVSTQSFWNIGRRQSGTVSQKASI